MKTVQDMVTDKQLVEAFANSNFGDSTKRDVVRYALMKIACGYTNGHTSQCIINELGLSNEDALTNFGKEYLYESFRNGTNH